MVEVKLLEGRGASRREDLAQRTHWVWISVLVQGKTRACRQTVFWCRKQKRQLCTMLCVGDCELKELMKEVWKLL